MIWIISSRHLFQPLHPISKRLGAEHNGYAVESNGDAKHRLLLELLLVLHLGWKDQLSRHLRSSIHFSELVNCSSSDGVLNAGA